MRRTFLLPALAAAILLAGSGVAWARPTTTLVAEESAALKLTPPRPGKKGPLSKAQSRAMAQGYLVPNQAAYQRLKAEARAKEAQPER